MTMERRYAEGPTRSRARRSSPTSPPADIDVSCGATPPDRIAKAVQQIDATRASIVMLVAEEPVTSGLVQSLAHSWRHHHGDGDGARRGHLWEESGVSEKDPPPPGSRIGVLFNATAENAHYLHVTEEVAQGLQVTLVPAEVHRPEDLEAAMAVMKDRNARGFIVLAGPLIAANTERINELAVRNELAVIWPTRRGARQVACCHIVTTHGSAGAVRRPTWTRFSRGPSPAPADGATDEIRAGYQPQDRQGQGAIYITRTLRAVTFLEGAGYG